MCAHIYMYPCVCMYICVYLHVCTCSCVCVSVCVWSCMWKPESSYHSSDTIPRTLSVLVFETELIGLGLTSRWAWVVRDPQGSAYIHFLSAGTATASHHLQLLYMVVKLKLEPSSLQDMHSMVGVINPGLFLTFFSKNPQTIFHISFTCFHFLHTHVSICDDVPCFVWPS